MSFNGSAFGAAKTLISQYASGYDHSTKTGDNTFDIYFTDGSKISITIPGISTSDLDAIFNARVYVTDEEPSSTDNFVLAIEDDGEDEDAEEYLTKSEVEDYIDTEIDGVKSELVALTDLDGTSIYKGADNKIHANVEVTNNGERIIFCSDLHLNASDMGSVSNVLGGTSPRANVEHFIDALNKEHRIRPIKAVFFLGDFTLNYGKDGLEYFVKHYLPQLDMPFYIGCGDHDYNTDDEVRALLGYGRNFEVEIGNNSYIFIDGYNGTKTLQTLDETTHKARIESALARGNSVYLMAHYSNAVISSSVTTSTWRSYIRSKVSGVFCAHTHNVNVGNSGYGDMYFHETGNFSYPNGADWANIGTNAENRRSLRNFEKASDGKYYTHMIYPTDTYTINSVTTTYDYDISEDVEVRRI